MAQLSAEEIFKYAVEAGFSPDQAVTMTAIALAESGGKTTSLNDSGEYSVGLWQINKEAHGEKFGNLEDPALNARAAFEVSEHGADISPWTVTHLDRGGRYQQFEAAALAAARNSGYADVDGYFGGTKNYGHPASAGDDGFAIPGLDSSPDPQPTVDGDDAQTPLERFLKLAVMQEGDAYDSAKSMPNLDDMDPDALDCSGLVKWAGHQAGVEFPHASWLQYFQVADGGGEMSVEEAMRTPGALLFKFDPPPTRDGGRPAKAHVAISLGDGRTIEAMGGDYGIPIAKADASRWTNAGFIPEFRGQEDSVNLDDVLTWRGRDNDFDRLLGIPVDPDAGTPTAVIDDEPLATPDEATDSDGDGLTDALETRSGWNAFDPDSDDDGLDDAYELVESRTDALRADSDNDGLMDSTELALGDDPLHAPGDPLEGTDTPPIDSDSDGISDLDERLLGFDPISIDGDDDGLTDILEASLDPLWRPIHPVEVDNPILVDDADGDD